MTKLARCCCGSLRAEVSADPELIAACHCEQCQRRTGSVIGVSAYFPAESVRTDGVAAVFERDGEEGRKVRMHFCPSCGTTVYWRADFSPDHIGIAVGAFFDPRFPPPQISAWEQSKHPWVTLGCDALHLMKQDAREF